MFSPTLTTRARELLLARSVETQEKKLPSASAVFFGWVEVSSGMRHDTRRVYESEWDGIGGLGTVLSAHRMAAAINTEAENGG